MLNMETLPPAEGGGKDNEAPWSNDFESSRDSQLSSPNQEYCREPIWFL